MADFIVEHERWQHASYYDFVAGLYLQKGHGQVPAVSQAQGRIAARVNQGRWIVECPNAGCGGALCVSSRAPYFLCYECGSPENGGQWYNVHFPPQKTAIERLLLLRPAKNPWEADSRNWYPSETVEELSSENRERGLPD